MLCLSCGVAALPYTVAPKSGVCRCGGILQLEADDLLRHGYNAPPGFERRDGQIAMGRLVSDVMRVGGMAVIEGPVGIGKSAAYSIPAVLSDKRVVIATAKKALQTQLMEEDLPRIFTQLNRPSYPHHRNPEEPEYVPFASLKGKSNYFCALNVEIVETKAEYIEKREERDAALTEIKAVRSFLRTAATGEIADYPGQVTERVKSMRLVDCLGRDCTMADKCPYIRHKARTKVAQVLVTNHSLVAFDFRLGHRIFGPYDILVVDEAHQFADYFRKAYTYSLSERSLSSILSGHDRNYLDWADINDLSESWHATFALLEGEGPRLPPNPFGGQGLALMGHLRNLREHATGQLRKRHHIVVEGNEWDEDVWATEVEPHSYTPLRHQRVGHRPRSIFETEEFSRMGKKDRDDSLRLEFYRQSLSRYLQFLEKIQNPDDNHVIVVETKTYKNKPYKVIDMAPVEVGQIIGPNLRRKHAVVITSATLAQAYEERTSTLRGMVTETKHDFSDIRAQLGISKADYGKEGKEIALPSPYNYRTQALLYAPLQFPRVPRGAGESGNGVASPHEWTAWFDAVARECRALIDASQGNAFVLFTARRDQQEVYKRLVAGGLQYPCIVQTEEQEAEPTLAIYRQTPNSVILGLKSFWEGVNVPGDKLRLVIIPKLPFPIVSDPILQARKERYVQQQVAKQVNEKTAKDAAFPRFFIPQMITDLRQGAGRLIRSKTDEGLLAILDTRLRTGSSGGPPTDRFRDYGGRAFLAMGFLRTTHELRAAVGYLRRLCATEHERAAK